MSRRTFTLPDLGEGLTEAHLTRWLVKVGDTVAVDAPVAEVETAKAVVEVPTPYGGVVTTLHTAEDTTVAVGAPLISVEPEQAAYVEEERAGSGNVLVGYGTEGALRGSRRHRRKVSAAAAPPSVGERIRVQSPIVRRLAREHGLDLSQIVGTGRGGLITRSDVQRAANPASSTAGDQRTGLGIRERVPLQGMRKAIAATLSRSRQEIPEATTWVDVDATALVELRESLRSSTEHGPGILAFLARFVCAGLARYPALNARVDTEAGEIVHFDGVNLGIATHVERGLVVPAVRRADLLNARELDKEIRRVVTAARDGAVEPVPGSFTLNNYGSFGVDGSAAIINYPEVAILGMGRILARPWVVEGRMVPRQLTQLSLVFDHRVCDGGTAAGFLRFVASALESPLAALADL